MQKPEMENKAAPVLLKLEKVSKRYESVSSNAGLEVLSEIGLEIRRGESVAIVGPSGSGKSTLLNIIGTLDRPTSGQVLLDGVDIAGLDGQAVATLRNRMIGFVFQA